MNKTKKPLTSEAIDRRRTLKNVMEGELFADAMEEVRQEIADQILKSNDSATRERLYHQASVLTQVQNRLESYVNDLLFLETQKKEEEAA
jgi:hypothetical protein